MKAVILAGGLGKRLGAITSKIPKPMVEIDGKPLLEHTIMLLKRYGITDIIICTGYLAGRIHDYFGDGNRFGVKITYTIEKELLGTGGALKLAEPMLDSTFLMLYGDLVIRMDLDRFIRFHKEKGGIGTLTVHPSSHPYDSDIIEVGPDSSIVRFLGKLEPGQKFKNISNAGVYCFEPSVFKFFPSGISMLDKEVLPSVLRNGGRLFAYPTNEEVFDIGTKDRLSRYRGDTKDEST